MQNIRVHFGIQESLSLFSPSRYALFFFKKPFLLFFDPQTFRRKLVIVSFLKKHVSFFRKN